jgi:hypothetical protein
MLIHTTRKQHSRENKKQYNTGHTVITLADKSRTRPSTNQYTETMVHVHVRHVVLSELLTPLSKELT